VSPRGHSAKTALPSASDLALDKAYFKIKKNFAECRITGTRQSTRTYQTVSHPVLEGKSNANHVRARIINSRTHQLHNMDIIT
jgi:hypothetical protein